MAEESQRAFTHPDDGDHQRECEYGTTPSEVAALPLWSLGRVSPQEAPGQDVTTKPPPTMSAQW